MILKKYYICFVCFLKYFVKALRKKTCAKGQGKNYVISFNVSVFVLPYKMSNERLSIYRMSFHNTHKNTKFMKLYLILLKEFLFILFIS